VKNDLRNNAKKNQPDFWNPRKKGEESCQGGEKGSRDSRKHRHVQHWGEGVLKKFDRGIKDAQTNGGSKLSRICLQNKKKFRKREGGKGVPAKKRRRKVTKEGSGEVLRGEGGKELVDFFKRCADGYKKNKNARKLNSGRGTKTGKGVKLI